MFEIFLLLQEVVAVSKVDAPISSNASEPSLIGNPIDWFSPDAYPPAAARAGEQGRVAVRLAIDEAGSVRACDIIQSSKSTTLDKATCAVFTAKAKFLPAHDLSGRVVAGQSIQRVNWVLPKNAFHPRTSFSQITRLDIAADGALLSCRSDVTGLPAQLVGDGCVTWGKGPPTFFKQMKGDLADAPAVVTIQTILHFDGDPPMQEEYHIAGNNVMAIGRAAFTVEANGQIANCHIVESGGRLGAMPLCEGYIGPFAPIEAGATNERGSGTMLTSFSYAVPEP